MADQGQVERKRNAAEEEVHQIMMAPHWAPQDFSRRKNEVIVLLLVKTSDPLHDKPSSFRASTDGDDTKAVVFPRSVVEILHSDGPFMVASMKGWVALDRKLVQGTVPKLADPSAWTDVQIAAWRGVKLQLARARDFARRSAPGFRPSHDRMPFGYTA